ncbi:hypothetical protein HMPREF0580_0942 [Mobiluncus mulieris ATCC 35239]|uniref:Uncharacterized protein n=1 Tax=Mobiluncus mulieris ATCC 35239 TaxID=871571 RepID=E0QQ15_9ACTO|nr:hypothetical protein HMPREF0577_0295 [Mobiluncus mulieris ATCC 35243]EFM46395.1 hypothetical protein HMPREF0580_0942 [Mobiluncus mulieris ATCC 35239]
MPGAGELLGLGVGLVLGVGVGVVVSVGFGAGVEPPPELPPLPEELLPPLNPLYPPLEPLLLVEGLSLSFLSLFLSGVGVVSPLICFTASGDTAPVPPIIVVAVSDLLASSQALVVEGRAWGWVKSIGVPFKPAAAEAAKASGKSTPVAI